MDVNYRISNVKVDRCCSGGTINVQLTCRSCVFMENSSLLWREDIDFMQFA